MAFPVVPSVNRLPNCLCYGRWGNEREPKKDNPRGSGKVSVEGKRAEIRVESADHTVLLLGVTQEHLIICSRMGCLCPRDVMTVLPKSLHDRSRHILVDEKPHQDVGAVLTG